MADRYWVGGAGSWDASSTTNWAASSGGASGASAPTSADNAIFDANSGAGSVTVVTGAICADVTFTGFTGTLAGTAAWSIYGSITLAAAMGRTYTGTITLLGTGTHTITANGKALSSSINLNGTGTYTMVGDLIMSQSTSHTFTVNFGTFDTGGYNLECGSFASSNTNTRTINLGASIILLWGVNWTFTTVTNLTFNAGTSLIRMRQNGSQTFNGGGLTYYDLHMGYSTNPLATMSGANTFHDLTFTGTAQTASVSISANQVVTGTLSVSGNGGANRFSFSSSTRHTPRTITAAAVSLSEVNFRDITAAGASAPWSGTSLADAGGNTNITFSSPVTYYWVGDTGSMSDQSKWATTSGGSGGAGVPNLQDTAIFDGNSFSTTGLTVTNDLRSWGNIDFSNVTNSPTYAVSVNAEQYGDIILHSSLTLSGTFSLSFFAKKDIDIDLAGLAYTCNFFTFDCNIGSVTFIGTGSLTGNQSMSITSGTLNWGDTDCSFLTISASGSVTRALTFNSPTVTLRGNNTTVISITTATNMTISGTPIIDLNYSGATGTRTIAMGGGLTLGGTVKVSAGTDIVALNSGGLRTVQNVDFTGFSGTLTGTSTLTFFGSIILSSTMAAYTFTGVFNFVNTTGDVVDFDMAGQTISLQFNAGCTGTLKLQDDLILSASLSILYGYLDLNGFDVYATVASVSNTALRGIIDSSGTAGSMYLSGSGTTVFSMGLVTNMTFDPRIKVYLTYTGSVGTRTITPGDIGEAMAPSFYVTGGTDVLSFTGNDHYGTIDLTGFTGSFSFNTNNTYIFGDFILDAGCTYGSATNWNVYLAGTNKTIALTTNGVSLQNLVLQFRGDGGSTINLTGNLTCGNINHFSGDFNSNNYTLDVLTWTTVSSNTNIKGLYLGSSTVNLRSGAGSFIQNGVVNYTLDAGTSTINVGTGNTSAPFKVYPYNSGANDAVFYDINYYTPSSSPTASRYIAGTFSCRNLTIIGQYVGTQPHNDFVYFSGSGVDEQVTVTGALTMTGASAQNPLTVWGRRLYNGANGTIVANGTIALTDVSFFHCILGGTATWSGTRVGDAGGNINLVADTPRTLYWIGDGGDWQDNSHWSLSSGGGSATTYPLPQDLCIFDANSFTTTGQIVMVDTRYIPSFRFTGVTNSPELDFNSTVAGGLYNYSYPAFVGAEYTFGNGMTIRDVDFTNDSINLSEPPTVDKKTHLTFNGTPGFPGVAQHGYWEVNNDGQYDYDAHNGTVVFHDDWLNNVTGFNQIGFYEGCNIEVMAGARIEVNSIYFDGYPADNPKDLVHIINGEIALVGNDPDWFEYGAMSVNYTGTGRFVVDTDLVTGGNVTFDFYHEAAWTGDYTTTIAPTIYLEGVNVIDVVIEFNYQYVTKIEKKAGEQGAVLRLDATGSNPRIGTLIYNGEEGAPATLRSDGTGSFGADFSIASDVALYYVNVDDMAFDEAYAGFKLRVENGADVFNNSNILFFDTHGESFMFEGML